MTEHSALIALLAERSAKQGEFTLASGRKSNFYIDARLTTMSPEGLSIIGMLSLETLRDAGWTVDAVGGLTLGADPISYAISYASAGSDHPIRAFTVRKEAKTHGAGKLIEGPLKKGDRVAVIEDVITTGDSAMRAIHAVEAAEALVLGVLALVDRGEGGRERIESQGMKVLALTTAHQIMSAMKV